MGVHSLYIGVPVGLEVKLRSAKETCEEYKLGLSGMNQAVALVMHYNKWSSISIIFNDVVKSFHKLSNTGISANSQIR